VRLSLPLLLVGLALVAVASGIGGKGAMIGGGAALLAQLAAVALLQPGMDAPQRSFLARWYGGMAIRTLTLAGVVAAVITHPDELPPLAMTLGFLGVLLPLLFLETWFLK
jgi:F0F1-type ATP synthase assembly protein I